jgi:hypothetical protein
MKLRTKTDELTTPECRRIVKYTIKWCQENIGTNNRRKSDFGFTVRLQRKNEDSEKLMGVFNHKTNELIIYKQHNNTVKDLIQTTIHEYTHYLQPIAKYYMQYAKKYDYRFHPMEIEARMNETAYYKKAWKFVNENH